MPGSCRRPQRLPALTLIGAWRGSAHDVLAIGDDGTVRWRVAGKLGLVHDGVAWIGDKSHSAGYHAATGERLWSAAGVDPVQYPNRIQGFRNDDGYLLFATDQELVAIG